MRLLRWKLLKNMSIYYCPFRRKSIGEVVRMIKSKSDRGLFSEFPFLKKKLWSGELWEDGYFARTIGDRMTRSIIERYIQSHKEITHGPA